MKNRILSLFIFFALFVFSVGSAIAQWDIVAIVNDDIITNTDVSSRIDLAIMASNLENSEAVRNNLRPQVLSSLIDEQIRLQEASRLGIKVGQKDMENAFDQIARQNNMPPEKFREIMTGRPSAVNSLKSQLQAQIAWSEVVRRTLRPKVNVTENDIDQALAEARANIGKKEYRISEIFLRFSEGSPDNKSAEMANRLHGEIKAGAPFPAVAQQFSQGPEASSGGHIGWVREDQLTPKLAETITHMEPNTLSPPLETSRGYHLVMLHDIRTVQPFAGGNNKLSLQQIFLPLPADAGPAETQKAKVVTEEIAQKATSCEMMKELATDYPHQLTGDMGYVDTSTMPAEMAELLNSLDIGKISEPVRIREGVLMLMVCDRQEADQGGNEEAIRNQIANIIGMERLNSLQERYLRDLKATSYIDVKE